MDVVRPVGGLVLHDIVIISIISVVFGALVIAFVFHQYASLDPLKNIPGSYGAFWIGEIMNYMENPKKFADTRFEKYGYVFRTKLWGKRIVFIGGPTAIDLICKGPVAGIGSSPECYPFEGEVYSFYSTRRRVAMMSELDYQHDLKRSIVVTAMHKLVNRTDFFDRGICKRMDKVFAEAVSRCTAGKVSGVQLCKDVALDITLHVFFAEMAPEKLKRMKTLLEMWLSMHNSWPVSFFGCTSWDNGRYALSALEELLQQEIKLRSHNCWEPGIDALGYMLQAAKLKAGDMSLDDCIDQIVMVEIWTLVHSMNRHIACACCWLLVALEQNPAVKSAAITEVRNYDGLMDYKSLGSPVLLPYLETVVEEVLRGYGILTFPIAHRETLFDIVFNGVKIPKGTYIAVSLASFNFNESIFSDPKEFRPERFTHSVGESLGHHTFGMGNHTCPGSSFTKTFLKLFGYMILNYYNLSAVAGQSYEPVFPHNQSGSLQTCWPMPKDKLLIDNFTKRELRNYASVLQENMEELFQANE